MKNLPFIQFFSISEKLDFWTYSLLKPDDSIYIGLACWIVWALDLGTGG
jgi:hypothetical protein